MTCNTQSSTRTAASDLSYSRPWIIEVLAAAWHLMRNRHQTRKLLELSDHHLADIGISRDDIRFSLDGPVTRDPTTVLGQIARQK